MKLVNSLGNKFGIVFLTFKHIKKHKIKMVKIIIIYPIFCALKIDLKLRRIFTPSRSHGLLITNSFYIHYKPK